MLNIYDITTLDRFGLTTDIENSDPKQIESLISYLMKRNSQLSVIRETAVRHIRANENGFPYPEKLENIIVNTISEW